MRSERVKLERISAINWSKVPENKRGFVLNRRIEGIADVLETVRGLIGPQRRYPFFFDDGVVNKTSKELAAYAMQSESEFFVIRSNEDKLLGFQLFEKIRPGHSAIWHVFLPVEAGCPFARARSVGEVLDYAFQEPPKGLGLWKLKLHITEDNYPARRLAEKIGAQLAGRLTDETFHGGHPYNMMIYELFSSAVINAAKEPLPNEIPVKRAINDDSANGGDDVSAPVHVHADSGAELRQLGDTTGNGDTEPATADGDGDDASGFSGGVSLARRPESNWYSVRSGGED